MPWHCHLALDALCSTLSLTAKEFKPESKKSASIKSEADDEESKEDLGGDEKETSRDNDSDNSNVTVKKKGTSESDGGA